MDNKDIASGRAFVPDGIEPVPVSPVPASIPDAAICPDCGKPADTTFWGVCRDCVPDHFAFDDDDDGDDGFDEFDDCGLMPNGQCLKAGSEECDWECGRLR